MFPWNSHHLHGCCLKRQNFILKSTSTQWTYRWMRSSSPFSSLDVPVLFFGIPQVHLGISWRIWPFVPGPDTPSIWARSAGQVLPELCEPVCPFTLGGHWFRCCFPTSLKCCGFSSQHFPAGHALTPAPSMNEEVQNSLDSQSPSFQVTATCLFLQNLDSVMVGCPLQPARFKCNGPRFREAKKGLKKMTPRASLT